MYSLEEKKLKCAFGNFRFCQGADLKNNQTSKQFYLDQ